MKSVESIVKIPSDIESYEKISSASVSKVAHDYHLKIKKANDSILSVPCSFQIQDGDYHPFSDGKASPEELQVELDRLLNCAKEKHVDLSHQLCNVDAAQEFCARQGYGIDCSNFAFRVQDYLHGQFGMDYEKNIYRSTNEMSWLPDNPALSFSVHALSRVLEKNPARLAGAKHMTSKKAAILVNNQEVSPGDLVMFKKIGTKAVSHVAVVGDISHKRDSVGIWHSVHLKNKEGSGVRQDSMILSNVFGVPEVVNQEALFKNKYDYSFCRPLGLAAIRASLLGSDSLKYCK
jgi:hypothetical protein